MRATELDKQKQNKKE